MRKKDCSGSQAYVKQHFADRETMQPKPEYYKLDAYFNDDTGTGRFRGIGGMGNDQVQAHLRGMAEAVPRSGRDHGQRAPPH